MQDLQTITTLCIAAAAAGYGAAAAVLLTSQADAPEAGTAAGPPRFGPRARLGLALMLAAWLGNAAVFVLNGLACGEPPLGNMYHVVVFLALCFLPLYLVLARKEGLAWVHAWFALTAALPLVGALFMRRDTLWRRMPALQSPWFVPHVVGYMIAYSLAGVAFALTVAGLVKQQTARQNGAELHARYRRASYQTARLGFPFMTFGLLSGALWAEEAWGAYWSWDTKETWSLITWILYLIYFHCRRTPSLRRYAPLVQVLAFLALLITFLVVNLFPLLGSVLHSYA
ncbi:MAG: cytochrome c biogenesis protein CcsA [Kiritimatiellae bacterium]|nr:cytochrome c biogenesis protein CcsA [Kiritimatiellia bacterium]